MGCSSFKDIHDVRSRIFLLIQPWPTFISTVSVISIAEATRSSNSLLDGSLKPYLSARRDSTAGNKDFCCAKDKPREQRKIRAFSTKHNELDPISSILTTEAVDETHVGRV